MALCNFTANNAMRSALIDAGAVAVLIALARSTRESTKLACAKSICNLSSLDGCEKSIVAAGGAAGLIMIALFRSDTTETKSICASALLNLMTDLKCREQLVEEDLVWVLIKLASSEDSNDETRSICGRALCSLSYSAAGCAKLVENKATPALYFLCRDGDATTKRLAAITLLNLSATHEQHGALLKQGAVRCLVELAGAEDPETRLHSVGALANLTASAAGRPAMITDNAAAALQLDKCNDKETMRRCAIALLNLSAVLDLQSDFVSQGALAGLLTLATDGTPLIKELVAATLFNLSFQPASRTAIVDAEALPPLVSLATSDSLYIRSLCSTAFANVSLEPKCHQAMVTAGAPKALVHLLAATDASPATQRPCLMALCQLSTNKAFHDALLQAG